MLCKKNWSKHVCMAALCLGMVSFLFGLLTFLIVKPDGHSVNTLLGMFTGFGAGIMGVALYMTIRAKVVSKEKLEQEEINHNDERNIAIGNKAGVIGFYTAFALLAFMAFLFMGLDYRVPSYACVIALYVLLAVVVISRKILEKKM